MMALMRLLDTATMAVWIGMVSSWPLESDPVLICWTNRRSVSAITGISRNA